MHGYHGRFLEVDLEHKVLRDIPIKEDELRQYIGGASLAAKLIFDQAEKDLDPLDPKNPLIFSTGPFTGTAIPMVSRYAVCGISPLTGFWGEATSGGVFPFRLKGAGYDGIFIVGKSPEPVYIRIVDGSASLRDASPMWGKDSYQTQQMIKDEMSEPGMSVACIGSAGENQLSYAGIMNDQGRAAGRCGLGALMGSKNLKAVAVAGNLKPDVADKTRITELAKQGVTDLKGDIASLALREYGTLFYMDMGMTLGDTPAKYFQKNVFQAEKVTGHALRKAYAVENYACLGCPVGCGRKLTNYKDIDTVDGPEYETVGAFGPLCMNLDLDTIIEANHLCNQSGLDTISTGVCIAYAMYLYEQGALTKDTAGMELNWGDGETVVKLVKLIIDQQGIGKLLSKGTLQMARELGRDEEEAAQVKGMEVPMHEGRAWHGLAISYATGPRGACHLKGDYYSVDIGGANPIMEYNIMASDRLSSSGKAENAAKYQNLKDLYDALTLCKFAKYSVTQICEILNAITGWDVDPFELMTIGERSINIKRAISNMRGLNRQQDHLPKICTQALAEGSTDGVAPDMERLLNEYYEFREWDWQTGKPTREKLQSLGLDSALKVLYPK